jgi:hypothetical protein
VPRIVEDYERSAERSPVIRTFPAGSTYESNRDANEGKSGGNRSARRSIDLLRFATNKKCSGKVTAPASSDFSLIG